MFDTLTREELARLAEKTHSAGNAFYESASAIASTALYMHDTGRIHAGDDAWNGLWNHRAPIVDAMTEMHELTSEIDATAAVRRTAGSAALARILDGDVYDA